MNLFSQSFDTLAVAVISFIFGNITGYALCRFTSKIDPKLDQDGRMNFLILAVTVIWIISVLVDILSPQYETSPLIHGIMGAIVGFFFWRPKTQ